MNPGPIPSQDAPSPASHSQAPSERAERATAEAHERAQHFGVSAMILGATLVFLAFLVRAERREMQSLLSASSQCEIESVAVALPNAGSTIPPARANVISTIPAAPPSTSSTIPAGPPSASSPTDGSMCAPAIAAEQGASGYGRSLLAAEAAAALAALTLVARRRGFWIAAVVAVLVCMAAATATFAGTRAEAHRILDGSKPHEG